jgi:hypothetical protein
MTNCEVLDADTVQLTRPPLRHRPLLHPKPQYSGLCQSRYVQSTRGEL